MLKLILEMALALFILYVAYTLPDASISTSPALLTVLCAIPCPRASFSSPPESSIAPVRGFLYCGLTLVVYVPALLAKLYPRPKAIATIATVIQIIIFLKFIDFDILSSKLIYKLTTNSRLSLIATILPSVIHSCSRKFYFSNFFLSVKAMKALPTSPAKAIGIVVFASPVFGALAPKSNLSAIVNFANAEPFVDTISTL